MACGHAEVVYTQYEWHDAQLWHDTQSWHDTQLRHVDGAEVRGLRHAEPCCNGVSNTSANQIQILDDSTEPDIVSTCQAIAPHFDASN